MPGWKATLFGKFNLEHETKTISGIEPRQVRELLSYLLLFRNHPQPRDALSEALWDNRSSARTRKCLRQTLWRLQVALRMYGISAGPDLLIDNAWIQLNLPADFWLDIAEFEKVFDLIKGKNAQALSTRDHQLMQYAVDIYKGDLLEGCYQDWCAFERERFQIMYLLLLDKLVQYCELHQKYEDGLAYGMKILSHDHAYERTHRQLMRLYVMTGNRTQALHQYERCVIALRDELDVEPSEVTKQLYAQIRFDTFKPSLLAGEKVISKARVTIAPTPKLKDVMNQLEQVSEVLGRLEHQIQEEVLTLGGAVADQS
ncbi:MAG TPA: BTAD domain-containing putative transcriptional regulator [Anaerolineales bacterium]|nr:BTAD domain-containing putative transcriptional regulator [Anaerolineales bacterium]